MSPQQHQSFGDLFAVAVGDSLVAAAVLCDRWQPARARIRPPVLAVPSPAYLAAAEPAAREAFARQIATLQAAGCEVRESDMFSDTGAIARHLFVVNRWELARTHDAWFSRYAERYRLQTTAAIMQGRAIEEADYVAAQRWRHDFAAAFVDRTVQLDVDAWVAPSAPGVAPKGLANTGDSVMSSPFSLVGGPVVSVPVGCDADSMPWGIQCAGTAGCDEQVLAAALFVESACSLSDRGSVP